MIGGKAVQDKRRQVAGVRSEGAIGEGHRPGAGFGKVLCYSE